MAHNNKRCDICKASSLALDDTAGIFVAHAGERRNILAGYAIYAQFRRVDVRQVGYVPDAGHSRLIALCRDDPQIADVVLTTEEEGVGLVAGAALGGQRAALLMQSSGVGNCVNMFSLLRNCGFGCIVLVTMRGEFGEFNQQYVVE